MATVSTLIRFLFICTLALGAALTADAQCSQYKQPRNPKQFQKWAKKYQTFVKKGDDFKQKGSLKKATKFYTKAIPFSPQPHWALMRLALAFQDEKNYEGAVKCYTCLIDLGGKNKANAYYQRSKVKAEAKDYDGAIADVEEAIKLSKAPLLFYLARANYKSLKGDMRGALEDCDKALAIQPTDGGTYLTRANIRVQHNDKGGACMDYLRAQEFGAEDADKMLDLHCKGFEPPVNVVAVPKLPGAKVDASIGEWSSIPNFGEGQPGRNPARAKGDTCEYDIKNVRLAQDGGNLFVAVEFNNDLGACLKGRCHDLTLATLMFDTDNDRETGGDEISYQITGFERRAKLLIRARSNEGGRSDGSNVPCTMFCALSLEEFDDLRSMTTDPFKITIPPTEQTAGMVSQPTEGITTVEFRIPLDKLKIGAEETFRLIFTEYERKGRSPFPNYYYGKL